MVWIKGLAVALVALAAILAALAAWGASRWQAGTRALAERLDAARTPITPARYDSARELPGLPAPVQRFFRGALTEGQPMIAAVDIEHRGSFNLGEASDNWKPFASRQHVVTRRPGFVWDGRVAMAPGLALHVHDAYVAGEGMLHPAVLGLFTIMDLRGSGDVAQGELMRWFAEAAWYPTALLPSQGVRWAPIDERSARATMRDGPLALEITFTFGDDGALVRAFAQARGRTVGGRVVPTAWEGVFSNPQPRNGMRVPMSGEVAWLTPEGRKPYWRGEIASLAYEFVR